MLLLVVAICIITLIYISKKRKAAEKEKYTAAKPSAASSVTEKTTVSEKIEKRPETVQNTIYKFETKAATRLCPSCDGENGANAETCIICGQRLS